jgi:metal-dependent HD superfamily phosphatase/phosphodiesterase
MTNEPRDDHPGAGTEPSAGGARPVAVGDRMRERVRIAVPARHNPKLSALLDRVNDDDDLYALWVAANVNAVDRLQMSDHGPVHVKIVTNLAVRMLRLFVDRGVRPSVVRDYGLEPADAEVVVALASLLHDVGMSIHRDAHEDYSLFLAHEKARALLAPLYDPPTAAIVRSEVLHAIIAHRADGRPLTLEAGIVRVADALDMAKGRSRIPFEAGAVTIHSVSAAAVEAVHLEPGADRPVRIRIEMSNSAGIFQVDELLRRKLSGSGLEPYVELEASVAGEAERPLVRHFRL